MAAEKSDPEDAALKPVRFSISLPAYLCFEVDALTGLYGPSRPQIVARIIDEWFHQNEAQIALRRTRFEKFRGTQPSPSSEGKE